MARPLRRLKTHVRSLWMHSPDCHRCQLQPITAKDFQESDLHAESPPPPEISNDDFADVEADLSIGREMVRRAMSTLEKTNDVSCLFLKHLQDHEA